MQETFLALFQHLPRLAPGPVGSWLTRVAVNRSLNERRRTREIVPEIRVEDSVVDLTAGADSPAADAVFETAEERANTWALLMILTPRQRAMVVMRFYGDCSFAEIADALACRSGTVRATIHQALRRLRQRMPSRQSALAE